MALKFTEVNIHATHVSVGINFEEKGWKKEGGDKGIKRNDSTYFNDGLFLD